MDMMLPHADPDYVVLVQVIDLEHDEDELDFLVELDE